MVWSRTFGVLLLPVVWVRGYCEWILAIGVGWERCECIRRVVYVRGRMSYEVVVGVWVRGVWSRVTSLPWRRLRESMAESCLPLG